MTHFGISPDRAAHWVKLNHQNRVPKRYIFFDTESKQNVTGNEEVQTWRMGAAIRWRIDLKSGDHAEAQTFEDPETLWSWVTAFCKPGQRTVCYAHNLGHDIRIANAFQILPRLGWVLEWCNLDRNVSSMTWRSEHGTLVFADTWTWLPIPLAGVAPDVGLEKLSIPPDTAKHRKWEKYCMRDAEIGYRVVRELIGYIRDNDLGNWQPTGAGMSYATWRHKFMTHKVLVHDDEDAINAERAAMHTGRAEAWRHGVVNDGTWTEVDMKNAYVRIAAECSLPTKLKFQTGAISNVQYHKLSESYAVLCRCMVDTDREVVPYHNGSRTLWPVGTFTSWLWDTEVNALLDAGGNVRISQAYVYTKAPIMRVWAEWSLSILDKRGAGVSPVVRTWIKHCSRALIGRISLRSPRWELFGGNPECVTGITHETNTDTGQTQRLMHIGSRTFAESERLEGRDSLPQITGWIMAECRVRLWEALCAAGGGQVAHLDTDSLLVSRRGLSALRSYYGARWATHWQIKGSWRRLVVYGPRNYRAGRVRKTAGVPVKAKEILPNTFTGERWHGLSTDMESGRFNAVTVVADKWTVKASDPRRCDAPGTDGRTIPCQVVAGVSVSSSSSSSDSVGA